jgi:hypothetical protein
LDRYGMAKWRAGKSSYGRPSSRPLLTLHRSLKDLSRFLNGHFSGNSTEALGEEVINEFATFVEENANIDDSTSQKLQEELLDIYSNHVVGDHDKVGPFVSVLRHLRPVITGDDRLCEWWNLIIRPSIDSVGHKAFVVEDAREFLLKVLVFDADEDKDGQNAKTSRLFTQRILDVYLERTKIPTAADDAITPEDEFIAHELESLLVTFGRKKPKVIRRPPHSKYDTNPRRNCLLLSMNSS